MTTIKLTDTETNKYASVYYLTSVDEETKDKIFKAHKENNLKALNKELGIKCHNILKYAKTSECKTGVLSDYIDFFKGANTGTGREIHYRDYTINYEEQKKNSWLINRCVDKKMSALSALRCMKETYLFLWRDDI